MSDKYLHGIEFIEVEGNVDITTASSSVIGIVGTLEATNPLNLPDVNIPFLIRNLTELADYSGGSILTYAKEIFKQTAGNIIAIRVADKNTDDDSQLSDIEIADNCAGKDIDKTGVFAFENSMEYVKTVPKLLCIPYYDQLSTGGIAITNMVIIAQRLRSIAIVSGPNTTDDEAITFAQTQNSSRVMIVDPFYIGVDDEGIEQVLSPSAIVSGIIAKTDSEKGFWWSPSNKLVNGIVRLNRPIQFNISNPDTSSNYLNEAGVSTFIYDYSTKSYKLWGGRSASSNTNELFICVRRTIDIIEDSIEQAQIEELAKPITGETINQIQNKVQTFLNSLISQGALLGGTCFVEKDLNPIANVKQGHLVISFDCEPPAPIERLTFRVYRNDGYYDEIFSG